MSSVYARNRNETPFDPVDFAAELQDRVTAYVHNEKRLPKRYRLTLGADLLKKADEITDYAIAANEVRATTPELLELRKRYWSMALTAIKQLDRKLKRLQKAVPSATASSMEEILDYMTKDEAAITNRRKHEKLADPPGTRKKKT